MTAKQNGKQQAQAFPVFPITIDRYSTIGETMATDQYKSRKAQIAFLSGWDMEWNELPTAQMPAVRK